jgi:hypothetical protein
MFHGLFLQSYLPAGVKFGESMQGEWLFEALRLNNPGPTLEYSFQALSVTRVGRFTGYQDLIERGKMLYGLALRSLSKSLGSPKLASRDETLAACCLLGIYEVAKPGSNPGNIPSDRDRCLRQLRIRQLLMRVTWLGLNAWYSIAVCIKQIRH